MFTTQLIILTIFVLAIFYMVKFLQKKKVKVTQPVPPLLKTILQEQVPFYQQLNENRKTEFEERTIHFLTQVKVTGVKTVVEDLDRVLIAASAIIPIFNFQGWEYPNLNEVLLYPDSFDHEFEQQGDDRNILGMVGSGALNQVMILSQFELLMQEKIKEIIDDRSDINPYGATNEAEFFAVVSEYFFERPELLKEKHPELYELLLKIFHPEPVSG